MNIPQWKEDLQSNLVVAAVGLPSSAVLKWIIRCWTDGVKDQELWDSKGFEQLEQNLSYGMLQMIEGAGSKGRILLADVHARRTRCLSAGVMLPGRLVF